jgi:hypothetical protein
VGDSISAEAGHAYSPSGGRHQPAQSDFRSDPERAERIVENLVDRYKEAVSAIIATLGVEERID